MRRSLALVAVGAAASTMLAAPSHAATPHAKVVKACNLIKDDAGDAKYNNVPGQPSDDLIGGDIASNSSAITAVIRLAGLASPDPTWLPGRVFILAFAVKGHDDPLFLSARLYPQGNVFVFGHQAADPTSGVNTSYTDAKVDGVVDTAKGEIHITAKLADISSFLKLAKGTKISGLQAQSYRVAGQGVVPSQSPAAGVPRIPLGGLLLPFDTADGAKPYIAGSPSCVAIGS